jgi:IS66 C-terminal element
MELALPGDCECLDRFRFPNALQHTGTGTGNSLKYRDRLSIKKPCSCSDTQLGAKAGANLYSIVGTCRANGIEPHAYLTHLYTELPKATTADHLEALLPWNVKPLLKRALVPQP